MEKKDLIIIGAGCSGLLAAVKLSEYFNITILESNTYLGGRIRTIKDNCLIEAGAEFIHGNAKLTKSYFEEAGLEIDHVSGGMYRSEKGKLYKEEEQVEGWDVLIAKMKAAEYDMTLNELLINYFNGNGFEKLRNQAIAYAGGFDLADPGKVSIKALYKEWTTQEEQSRPAGGYSGLINYFADKATDQGVSVKLDQTVIQVDWEEGYVTVYTKDGKKYNADKLLVTVPVSVLALSGADNSINFTPPVDSYVKAAAKIGYGGVIKFVFEFSNPLWPDDTGFIFSEGIVPTWWVRCRSGEHLITGWLGGPQADKLADLSDDRLIELAIESLEAIFGKASGELDNIIKEKLVFNWTKNPAALGGYSYPALYDEEAKQQLNQPVRETIYFTGEALHMGDHPGTVEAALDSAEVCVKKILRA